MTLSPELPVPCHPPEHPGWQTSHLGLHLPPSWGHKAKRVQVEIFHLTQTRFYLLGNLYSRVKHLTSRIKKKVSFYVITGNILSLWAGVSQCSWSSWCGSSFLQAAQAISSHTIPGSAAVWTCVWTLKVCECLYKALTVNFSFSSSMLWSLFFHPL